MYYTNQICWFVPSLTPYDPPIAPSDCFPMTGIGRFENTIFLLTTATILQLDERPGPVLGTSRAIASFPSSGPAFPKLPVRRITANGFGSEAIVPSRRWCPISRLGLPY